MAWINLGEGHNSLGEFSLPFGLLIRTSMQPMVRTLNDVFFSEVAESHCGISMKKLLDNDYY